MLLIAQIILAVLTLIFALITAGETGKTRLPYYAGLTAVSIVALTVTLLF